MLVSIYEFSDRDEPNRGNTTRATLFSQLRIPVLKAVYTLNDNTANSGTIIQFLKDRVNIENDDFNSPILSDINRIKGLVFLVIRELSKAGLIFSNGQKNSFWKISNSGIEFLELYNLIKTDEIFKKDLEEARKDIGQLTKENGSNFNNGGNNKIKYQNPINIRYWALDFFNSERLRYFDRRNYWQYSFSEGNIRIDSIFNRININDEVIIKSSIVKRCLPVYYQGKVISIDRNQSKLFFERIDDEEYFREVSGGFRKWKGIIIEVKDLQDIQSLFYNEVNASLLQES